MRLVKIDNYELKLSTDFGAFNKLMYQKEKEVGLDLCEYDIEPKDTVCDLWTKEVTAFTGSSLSKKIAPHSVWAVRIG